MISLPFFLRFRFYFYVLYTFLTHSGSTDLWVAHLVIFKKQRLRLYRNLFCHRLKEHKILYKIDWNLAKSFPKAIVLRILDLSYEIFWIFFFQKVNFLRPERGDSLISRVVEILPLLIFLRILRSWNYTNCGKQVFS